MKNFPFKLLTKNPKEMGYIKAQSKTSRWAEMSALAAGGRPARSTANGQIFDCFPIQRANALWSVDRSVDRPNPESKCSLVGRPLGRPSTPYGRPVGRPSPPESGILAVGRPLGRPAQVAGQRARFVHVGRPVRSTARAWQAAL